jgi:hypothetical protein
MVDLSVRVLVPVQGVSATFTVSGSGPKSMLIRGIGPALAGFGVSGTLADPQLTVTSNATGAVVASNDDWGGSSEVTNADAAVGAFALTDTSSKDAALVATFAPGTYTVRLSGAGGSTGEALIELYDADTVRISTLTYMALQAPVGTGANQIVAGLNLAGPNSPDAVLIRAVGPSLGAAGTLPDPALSLYTSGSSLIDSNTGWGNSSSIATASSQVGAFPLMASSADSALLESLNPGAYSVDVAGASGDTGMVLLEFYDTSVTGDRAPYVVSSPSPEAVASGSAASFSVVAVGTGTLTYQWRLDGSPITGAINPTLSFPSVQAQDEGIYDVVVTNSAGSTTSAATSLIVTGVSPTPSPTPTPSPSPSPTPASGFSASQAVASENGYFVTITNTFTYPGTIESLGWEVDLPDGWTFVSNAGSVGDVAPTVGEGGTIAWAWISIPASPITFTYTVEAPFGAGGPQELPATVIYGTGGNQVHFPAAPAPLDFNLTVYHSADEAKVGSINLSDLTRVIELYNTRFGNIRTGCYLTNVSSEDGFDPDLSRPNAAPFALPYFHSADEGDVGNLDLSDLTRVIEIYNYRSGSVRTGQYSAAAGTEDGFQPGP